MRVIVSGDCIGCGMCEDIAYEVFEISDEGTAQAVADEISDEFLEEAQEAQESCPAMAISIVEGGEEEDEAYPVDEDDDAEDDFE